MKDHYFVFLFLQVKPSGKFVYKEMFSNKMLHYITTIKQQQLLKKKKRKWRTIKKKIKKNKCIYSTHAQNAEHFSMVS